MAAANMSPLQGLAESPLNPLSSVNFEDKIHIFHISTSDGFFITY
ncbi:Uncharacterized protein dnm_035840 [Desulfonema magnum]|uniref:Uncharacterized protein n=1 Tax=Desulfonema magnum TaxID=45655 RepID=A0A975BM39_9BACT|nr:Uncharacterized protein dnm_035840 [Desulfonema magnum]